MDKALKRTLIALSLFAVAMGLLESAVVIYLRDILYPGGFAFPLSPIRPDLVWTEMCRELATLVMLVSVGFLAGRNTAERFAWFLYAFALWDIFYYVFLFVLVGWPSSLMTWDILFLLPVTWTGPVITPLIVSLTMILFDLLILFPSGRKKLSPGGGGKPVSAGQTAVAPEIPRIPRLSWILLVLGSLLLIVAFTWDYSGFVLERMDFRDIWTLPGSQVHALVHQYIPRKFNWTLFIAGEAVILSGIAVYRRRRN